LESALADRICGLAEYRSRAEQPIRGYGIIQQKLTDGSSAFSSGWKIHFAFPEFRCILWSKAVYFLNVKISEILTVGAIHKYDRNYRSNAG
jgi:hypothetical protein